MALSKADNFEQAQAAIKCDLCGGEDGVKHYCLICEETMCPTCKAIHNKARATRDHKVVLREERHTKDQGSTFCKKHPDQKTSLYCDTCTIPVCSKCVSGAHYGHKFSDFSLVLENFKREIKDSKKKLETKMEEADALIQTGNQSWKDYENIVEKIRSSICQNYKSLLDKRENELTRISHQDKTAWNTAKDQLDEEKTKISRCLAQHEKCLSSTTITGMVELLKESEVLRRKILDPVEIVPPSYQEASAWRHWSNHKANIRQGRSDIVIL
ncbi:hypothetical protein FSP39_013089 [Pinctada imbricata]|uniref:B box-type domain-containing protein n=1 Tax=Pinctada imbricata TaxID=66713 RepID=A0AA88Y3V5_PINIB|nr:hypothetical protein FSP39_013089 [Pinctada imbricata]